ncbi:MAG: flagellar basal body-associated FliL family protein [Opitutaceae bacterium]
MAEEKKAKAADATEKGKGGGFLPLLLVIILVPAISYAMTEFLVIPKMKAALASSGHEAEPAEHGSLPDTQKGAAIHSVEFKDIVSNIAGSMKSRYIKVSFTAYSADPEIEERVKHDRAKLLDATLSILSSLTLAELEEAGVKNKIRTELLLSFESVMHARLFEELYFSEFVVQ